MQVLRFWEVLWSGHLSRQFHVYCAAAVLERHRRTIMERDLDFDGLLKCANLPAACIAAVKHGEAYASGSISRHVAGSTVSFAEDGAPHVPAQS